MPADGAGVGAPTGIAPGSKGAAGAAGIVESSIDDDASDTAPEPVIPGTAFDYVIPIRADHHRFVAGHSLRLRISGGKSESLVPPAQPVDITIHTGSASALYLSPGWAHTD